jgi:uncharacterized beta-barrel protein YwiB (DUF1934 family)
VIAVVERVAALEMPVKVVVRTTISQGDESEVFELVTFGRFFHKGSAFYLFYEEELDVGKIKTSVKFSDNDAVLIRSGAVNMRLAFHPNRQMKGHYETPYGTMDTMTDTKGLTHQQMSDKEGKLNLLYDFMLQEDHAGTYQLEISYKKEGVANEHS